MSLPKIREGRLVLDGSQPGDWNMAVDELLLENADRGELGLRFYSWRPATLSLGYFQAADARRSHPASRDCPLIRRPSGGGALIHGDEHHELTYSLAVPDLGKSRHLPPLMYDALHHCLIEALRQFGVTARRADPPADTTSTDAFLCFQRLTAGDVLIGHPKVAGSAQRRAPRALLQHGSVLLSQMSVAPELPGFAQLTGCNVSRSELQSAWLGELVRLWPVAWRLTQLSADEQTRAEETRRKKFARAGWNLRR